MKIKEISKTVEEVLRDNEIARMDDNYLIECVIRKIAPMVEYMSFGKAFDEISERHICIESITRARRNLQNKYPELREKNISEARYDKEQEYIDYANDEDSIRQHVSI